MDEDDPEFHHESIRTMIRLGDEEPTKPSPGHTLSDPLVLTAVSLERHLRS